MESRLLASSPTKERLERAIRDYYVVSATAPVEYREISPERYELRVDGRVRGTVVEFKGKRWRFLLPAD